MKLFSSHCSVCSYLEGHSHTILEFRPCTSLPVYMYSFTLCTQVLVLNLDCQYLLWALNTTSLPKYCVVLVSPSLVFILCYDQCRVVNTLCDHRPCYTESFIERGRLLALEAMMVHQVQNQTFVSRTDAFLPHLNPLKSFQSVILHVSKSLVRMTKFRVNE